MNLSEIQDHLIGSWTGTNLLRLSWLAASEFSSPSLLFIEPVAQGKCLGVKYTWSHKDEPHEGFILIGYDKKHELATAAWVDSWHMNNKIMACQGGIDDKGVIDLLGSYEAPPDPDWGWRIRLSSSNGSTLQMVMYNVTPDGEEDLAVQAEYSRAG